MNRPYVFCHMMTSLDGKIMGNYMKSKEGVEASNEFYELAYGKESYYKHQGWISGRVTTDDKCTCYAKQQVEEQEAIVQGGNDISKRKKVKV